MERGGREITEEEAMKKDFLDGKKCKGCGVGYVDNAGSLGKAF